MSRKEEIESRLKTLTDFVVTCNERVRNGEMVNLQALDDEVAKLCEEITALPQEEAEEVQPLMAGLISNLETLGTALQQFRDKMKEEE